MTKKLLLSILCAVLLFSCKKDGKDDNIPSDPGTLLDVHIEKVLTSKDGSATMKVNLDGLRYESNLTGILNYNLNASSTAITGETFAYDVHLKYNKFPSDYVNSLGYSSTQPEAGFRYGIETDYNTVGLYQFSKDPGNLEYCEITTH